MGNGMAFECLYRAQNETYLKQDAILDNSHNNMMNGITSFKHLKFIYEIKKNKVN